MIKKILVLLTCAFNLLPIYSQEFGYAEYGVAFNTTLADDQLKEEDYDFYLRQKAKEESCEALNFVLLINNDETLFYHADLENPENALKFAKTNTDGDHVYYTHLESKILIDQFPYWGSKIRLNKEFNKVSWKITDESKKIGQYTCFKAFKNVTTKEGGRDHHHKVTAWFTPEIPLQSGPKEYGGLPGLIVELTENHLTYYLKKVKFGNHPFEAIIIPDEGILMSEKEFSEKSASIKRRAKQAIINSRG